MSFFDFPLLIVIAFDIHGYVHRTYISNYNQQDATLNNLFISVKCSTYFRRYLRPTLGAQKLPIQHRVLVKPLLLPAAIMEELELDSSRRQ
jgi:hypothetical protein